MSTPDRGVPVTLDRRERRNVLIAAAAIVVVALVGLYIVHAVTGPRVGSADAARTVATVAPGSAGDQACLDRVTRAAGWLDLCWEVVRIPYEEDPVDDYWAVRIFGTVHGDGPGVKWAVVQATFQGDANRIRETEPNGSSDGPCREVEIEPGWIRSNSGSRTMTACEHLERNDSSFPASTTWTCGSCIFGIRADREIALVQVVAIPGGERPSWEVAAGFGG